MFITALPLFFLGSTALLLMRLGWAACIGLILLGLLVPLTDWVSSLNGQMVKEMSSFKEQRVQITTEMIEGIKYIKLYGW